MTEKERAKAEVERLEKRCREQEELIAHLRRCLEYFGGHEDLSDQEIGLAALFG